MSKTVLDTSALLALLFDATGADAVIARGHGGLVSAVNYSEMVAKSLDRGVPVETAQAALVGLDLSLSTFDRTHAMAAAAFRVRTRHLNASFADRACLATAALSGLPVLTADRDWAKADLGVEIILIRK